MFKYLIKNPHFCFKSLYTFHCYFSIQNGNKAVLRSIKLIVLKPKQIVNFFALRILKGFSRFSTMYYDEAFFDPSVVSLFYQRDKINITEWLIVYNHPLTNLYSNGFRLCFCFVFGILSWMFFDYKYNGKFTDEFSVKLHRDFIMLGIFGYFIFFTMLIVFTCLTKINSMTISRIYLNRNDPSKLLLRGSRFILFRPLTSLNKKDVKIYYNEDDNRFVEALRYCLNGHAKFGHLGNYALAEDGFRSNSFRSYILNESTYLPMKLLNQLDLNSDNNNKQIVGKK